MTSTADTPDTVGTPGAPGTPGTPGTAEAVGNWGRWGADDERGTLNLITPETVAAAAHEVRTGRSFALGLPIARDGYPHLEHRGAPSRLTLSSYADRRYDEWEGGEDVGANEDVLIIPSHNVTHMDALCHVQHKERLYNGFAADTFKAFSGAGRCGIEKAGAFAARAVLADVARHQGVNALEPGTPISAEQLEACLAAQGTEVREGDVLLVRTGHLDLHRAAAETGREGPVVSAGLDRSTVAFLRDRGIAAVGSDNTAVEVIPFDGPFLSVHIELLVNLGMPMLEHLWLTDLAAAMAQAGAFACLLSVTPLPVTGATGSPVNPVAVL